MVVRVFDRARWTNLDASLAENTPAQIECDRMISVAGDRIRGTDFDALRAPGGAL
jgi:hypothetical protein